MRDVLPSSLAERDVVVFYLIYFVRADGGVLGYCALRAGPCMYLRAGFWGRDLEDVAIKAEKPGASIAYLGWMQLDKYI